MRSVPRHEFVPRNLTSAAYDDRPLDIGLRRDDLAALYCCCDDGTARSPKNASCAGDRHRVGLSDRHSRRACREGVLDRSCARACGLAAQTLDRLGISNAFTCDKGMAIEAGPRKLPFDRIILTAAPWKFLRHSLTNLSSGGRLIAPIGRGADQQLVVLDKSIDGHLSRRTVFPVLFVPMFIRTADAI